MSTTLLALARHIALELGYLQLTPSAGGTTTTVVDNDVASGLDLDDSNSLLYNGWLKCEADSAATPLNVGEVRRIDKDTGYVATTGTLTTTRAFSNASTTTQTYGWYGVVPPTTFGLDKGILQYINDVLRLRFYKAPVLLTLVTDGDMAASGTTSWTATTATLAKVTTAANVATGKQSMSISVLGTSATGYATSGTTYVRPGERYCLVADVQMIQDSTFANSIVMEAYDESNSTVIDSVTSSAWTQNHVSFSFTIPSGCDKITVRFKITTNGTLTAAVIDNVSLRHVGSREFALPSWFLNVSWAERLDYLRGGTSASSSNDDLASDERDWHKMWFDIFEDEGGATPYKLRYAEEPPYDAHMFLRCTRPYAELSADTDTTEANKDWVRAHVLAQIWADKGNEKKAIAYAIQAQAFDRAYNKRVSRRLAMGSAY